jgi:hypothetical protein
MATSIGPQSFAALTVSLLAMAFILFALARPGQSRSATGTIVSKTLKKGGVYMQTPSGVDRGFRTPTPIPIADAFVFEIRVDGEREVVRGSLNTIAGRTFEPGQRVVVEYERRGLPFFGRRLLFTEMRHAEPEGASR